MDNTVITWIIVIGGAVAGVIAFFKLPYSKQVAKIKECLLSWVVTAEKELGGGTGQVKLSMVYDMFVNAFPFLKNFVSFTTFSFWVDSALDTMRHLLETNPNLHEVVTGETMLIP